MSMPSFLVLHFFFQKCWSWYQSQVPKKDKAHLFIFPWENGRTEFVRIGICQSPFFATFWRNWKLSESEIVKIGICQIWKLSKLEFVRIGIYQNQKLSESELVRIGICQIWNLTEFEIVRIGNWQIFKTGQIKSWAYLFLYNFWWYLTSSLDWSIKSTLHSILGPKCDNC